MKKYILSLFVWLFWLISFCSAWSFTIEWNIQDWFKDYLVIPQSYYSKDFSVHCVFSSSNLSCQWWDVISFALQFSQIYNSTFMYSTLIDINSYSINCDNLSDLIIDYDFSSYSPSSGWPYSEYYWVFFLKFNRLWFLNWVDIPYYCTFSWQNILNWWWSSEDCEVCPEIDTNYCVWNWLCPSEVWTWDWEDFSWDLQYSNLYINNILHPWKQNIFVDIPDYITRDYNSTWDDFNLYVGSWYDVEYIESIININSYRPSSEDFTNIFVSWLTLVFPYIFVLLLIVFIWKLLKRIFK